MMYKRNMTQYHCHSTAEPDYIRIIKDRCAGDLQGKNTKPLQTSELMITIPLLLCFLDRIVYGKRGHWEFNMQRKKAAIRYLAEMFGCRTGTLSKSSLFSHGPPSSCLQHLGQPRREQGLWRTTSHLDYARPLIKHVVVWELSESR